MNSWKSVLGIMLGGLLALAPQSRADFECGYSSLSGYSGSEWQIIRAFALEVLQRVDADPSKGFNFTDYDGNGDGEVDMVVVFFPKSFHPTVRFTG